MKNFVSETEDKAHSVHLQPKKGQKEKKELYLNNLILCNIHCCSSGAWFCMYTPVKTYSEQNCKELPFHLAFSHL